MLTISEPTGLQLEENSSENTLVQKEEDAQNKQKDDQNSQPIVPEVNEDEGSYELFAHKI